MIITEIIAFSNCFCICRFKLALAENWTTSLPKVSHNRVLKKVTTLITRCLGLPHTVSSKCPSKYIPNFNEFPENRPYGNTHFPFCHVNFRSIWMNSWRHYSSNQVWLNNCISGQQDDNTERTSKTQKNNIYLQKEYVIYAWATERASGWLQAFDFLQTFRESGCQNHQWWCSEFFEMQHWSSANFLRIVSLTKTPENLLVTKKHFNLLYLASCCQKLFWDIQHTKVSLFLPALHWCRCCHVWHRFIVCLGVLIRSWMFFSSSAQQRLIHWNRNLYSCLHGSYMSTLYLQ